MQSVEYNEKTLYLGHLMSKKLQEIIDHIELYSTVATNLDATYQEHSIAQLVGGGAVGLVAAIGMTLALGPLGLAVAIPFSLLGVGMAQVIKSSFDRYKLRRTKTIKQDDLATLMQISHNNHLQTRYQNSEDVAQNLLALQPGYKTKIIEKASLLLEKKHLDILKKCCADSNTSPTLLKMLNRVVNKALTQEKINVEQQQFDLIESKLPHLEETQNKPVPTVFVEYEKDVSDIHTAVSTSTKKHSI